MSDGPEGGDDRRRRRRLGLLAVIGPGVLVAATGVGAGDLATAGFAGSLLGVAVAWAVVLGAFAKFVLTEGLARWQLATGETVLEGAASRLGIALKAAFLVYFLAWTWFTAAALMTASGVAASALVPLGIDAEVLGRAVGDRHVYGAAHSIVAIVLVLLGGYKVFERVMSVAVVVMVGAVLVTAARFGPDVAELVKGLTVPRIPDLRAGGLTWTVSLMGGVGGTVTVLCYGYWIREEGRSGGGALRGCRLDLAIGYAVTAVFGVAMLVIASGVTVEGGGAALLVNLGDRIGERMGPAGRWVFLVGAWAAIASSMLGVWQAVPYLFADFMGIVRGRSGPGRAVNVRGWAYRGYLLALGIAPAIGMFTSFKAAQRLYAVVGAGFIPALALVLLALCNRREMGSLRNRWWTNAVLVLALALAAVAGGFKVWEAVIPGPG